MIVIVEGPDGSGKSTFAESLAKFETVHFGPVEDPFEEYRQALRASRGRDVVFDRIWPSEIVYGNVLRGGNRLTDDELEALRSEAAGQGAVVVKCLPRFDAVIQNAAETEQMEGVDRESLDAIYKAYRSYSTPLPSITYDYTSREAPDEDELRELAESKATAP